MSNVVIAPTLHTMSVMYALSRDGGPKSERFLAYVARVEHEWGLVAYNPMAGDAARETVTQLLSLDAENVARDIGECTAILCEYEPRVTLALVVRSKEMWTDRVATEVDDRLSAKRSRASYGLVSMWSRDLLNLDDVTREVVAETVRVMWASIHGASDRIETRFAREGLAYAIAARVCDVEPYGGSPSMEERMLVLEALEMLCGTRRQSEIVAVLYGDDVATTIGFDTRGVGDRAGYRVAIDQAADRVRLVGAARALRNGAPT